MFSLIPHCSHKIKTTIIIPSIQNQNSLLVKWQTNSIMEGVQEGEEISPLLKRSERRQNIILHPDSLREKAILIAFVSAEGI